MLKGKLLTEQMTLKLQSSLVRYKPPPEKVPLYPYSLLQQ